MVEIAEKQRVIGTPYQKGTSGNPNGRPKKPVCVTSWLKEYACQKLSKPVDIKNLTFAQAAALKHWQLAVKGDLPTYNFIIDRIEGKVKDHPVEVNLHVSPQELTDEQLGVIIATNTIRNHASNGSAGAIEAEASEAQAH